MAGASAHRPSVAPTSKVGCIADFQIREPGIVQVALEFCCVADLEIGDTAGLETYWSVCGCVLRHGDCEIFPAFSMTRIS